MTERIVPSLDDFLKAARPLNPTYTDEEITREWSSEYGQPVPPRAFMARDEFMKAARPLNPTYTDLEISQQYDIYYGQQAPKVEQGNIARGFNVAMEQVPQLAAGIEMGVGAAGEWAFGKGGVSSDLKARGQEWYDKKTQDLQALSKETDSVNTSWERATSGDIGALKDWAGYAFGYVGGQAIQALATAGVGSIAGKLVLRPAVASLMEGMVAKETAALAGTKAVEGLTAEGVGKLATANVAGRIGQNTALAVTAGGMEGGEIFGDLVSEANREGRDLTGYELARAFGMTIAAGSLEFLGDKLGMVDIVMGKSRLAAGVTGRLARAGRMGAEFLAIEGGTEFAQTLLEEAGKGKDPLSQASIRDAIDAAALGAFGGAVIGGARGLLSSAPTAGPTEDQTAPPGAPPAIPPSLPLGTSTVAPGEAIATGETFTQEVDRAIQESSRAIGEPPAVGVTLADVTPASLDQAIQDAQVEVQAPLVSTPGDRTATPEATAHSIADIHALATQYDIPWDNDPAFLAFTESVTGKRHLDELTPQERNTLYSALNEQKSAALFRPNAIMDFNGVATPVRVTSWTSVNSAFLKTPDGKPHIIGNAQKKLRAYQNRRIPTSVGDNDFVDHLKKIPRVKLPAEQNAAMLERAKAALEILAAKQLAVGTDRPGFRLTLVLEESREIIVKILQSIIDGVEDSSQSVQRVKRAMLIDEWLNQVVGDFPEAAETSVPLPVTTGAPPPTLPPAKPSTTAVSTETAEATRQAAIQAERARLQALAVPPRDAAKIEKEIDALETQLDQQGINSVHLYDAADPGNDVLKGYKDYQPMPEGLARLYRERDAIYAQDQIEFREKTVADSGLPPKEAGKALDALYLREGGLIKIFSDVLNQWNTSNFSNLTTLYNHFAAIKYEDFEMYFAKFSLGGTADAPAMTGKVVRGGALDPELLRKTEQVYNAISKNIGSRAISLSRLRQLTDEPSPVDVTPVGTADPALVPRHQLPDAANADMLARAEKGEADLASLAGTDTRSLLQFLRDRGGVQDQGKELTNLGVDTNRKPFQKKLIQATGLTLDDAAEAAHEAGLIPSRDMNLLLQAIDRELRQGTGPAWITEATAGSGEKLTRARVDAAIQKILVDEGQDVGKDVARVKALLLADPEFASSGFALKTDADVQAMITEAKAGQQEIPVPPPTIGERPIYGAEKPLEDMPLFSKEAQTPAPEQTELLPAAPAATAPVVAKPTRPLPKGPSPVTAAGPTAPSTAAAAEKEALQDLKLKNMFLKQKKAPAAPSDTPSTAVQELDGILTDEEKQNAAAALGMGTTWTDGVAKAFLSQYAAWVQAGAKNLGTLLGELFKKVLAAAKIGILSLAVIVNLSAPISITSASIPLTSATIEASLATPRANFSGQSTSTEMRVIADWAVRTQQGKGKSFLLVDKKAGYLYVFNREGVLDATAPVLLGLTKADVFPAGRTGKTLSEFSPEDKVTPAGVFAATFDATDSAYGTTLDYTKQGSVVLAVHRVYLGNESREQRQARLDTETGEDNRISFGCLNVTRAFMRDVINPYFKDGGVVIIAPEMSDPYTFFGITRPETPQPAQDPTSASLGALAIMGMTRKKETPETPGFVPAIPPAEIDNQRLNDVIMIGQTLWDMRPITFEDWYVKMADGLDADHLPYLSAAWSFLLERAVAINLREAQFKPLVDYAIKLTTQGVVGREAFLARFTKVLGQKISAPYAEGLFAAIFNPREVFDDIAIRNQQQANQPSGGLLDETGRGGTGTDTVDVPAPPVGDGTRTDEDERIPGERPGPVADPADRGSGGPGVGLQGAGLHGGTGNTGRRRNQNSGLPTESGGAAPGGLGGEVPGATGLETGISVEDKANAVTDKTDSSYVPYESPLEIPGQQPHPGAIVESASLASTKLPPTTYVPNLPKEIIEKGLLSSVQLVPVVYAGESHSRMLPDGTRQGFFIGDGTGVGKGREIAAIIMDNMRRGYRTAVWVSETTDLMKAAIKDWSAIGGDPALFSLQKDTHASGALPTKPGIIFTTYTMLREGSKIEGGILVTATKKSGAVTPSRLDQLIARLGPDFSGVIAFDESHNMANTDTVDASTQALAGVKLTHVFTDARVLYASATAAKNPQSLMYAERLGLWGERTGFASKKVFLESMEKGGLGAMEVLIRDLKADGKYLARTLDYADVSYATLEHPLDSLQTYAYNESADAWDDIYTQIESALNLTQTTDNPIGPFRAAHQRFFEQMLSSFALTPALPAMQATIADGHVVVAQLINTGAAAQKKQLETGIATEDLDLSPKQIMVSFLTQRFPIHDKTTFDLQGNPTNRENPAARAMRDALLKKYENLSSLPQSPIDLIVNTLGAKNVAEVTGRKKRLIVEEDGTTTIEARSDQQVSKEVREFKDDTRRALIFSQKGGTGQSYHASQQEKNQRKRHHYIVQLGYRAEKVLQALGRTHRSNQASAPSVFLLLTNAKGHKRFVATIAKRLDALGAMTQGQRQGTASGLISAQNNFDSIYATEALQSLLSDLYYDQIQTVADNRAAFTRMGFMSLVQQTGALNPRKTPKVETFLNRLLGLRLVDQDQVFDAFYSRLVNLVTRAEAEGTLNAGIRTVRADRGITKIASQIAYTNPDSGAVSRLDTFEAKQSIKFTDFDALSGRDFFRNDRSQHVWAFSPVQKWTNASGNAEATYYLQGPVYSDRTHSINAREIIGYTKVTPEEARAFWDRTIAEHPQFTTTTYHMMTGGLLRIWERLPSTSQRIVRLQTTDGTRYIGRLIENSDIKNTKANLGLGQAPITMSAERLIEKVLTEGSKVRLSNGTILQSRKLNNQTRVEVARAAWLDEKFIKQLRETVPPSSEIYYLLPQDPAQAAAVLRDILRQHEAVEIVDVNEKGTLREERLPYGESTTSDVGERIPGARKHQYEHLKIGDIENMPPEERLSLVTKQSIWKPDYRQLVSDGMEPRAAALLKVAYDGMPANLNSMRSSAWMRNDPLRLYRAFHQMVGWMKDRVNEMTEADGRITHDMLYNALTIPIPDNVLEFAERIRDFWMREPVYYLKSSATKNSIEQLLAQGFPNQVPWTRRLTVTQVREGSSITERFILKGWEDLRAGVIFKQDISLADPSVVKDLREFGLWVVLDKENSLKAYAAGRAAAEAKAEALYEAMKTDATDEERYERPYLADLVREGPSVRGDRNVTSEDFQREFLIRGLQFGNYVSEGVGARAVAERQSHLNRAYDALQDLADVLGIPTSAIGLGGTLGLAIGARGRGGKGAPAAHYEPTTVVINLTKMKGAGALAHEWGHALDHYLGEIGESTEATGRARTMSGGDRKPFKGIANLPSLRPELLEALQTLMSRLYTSKVSQAQAVRKVELELEKVKADISNKLEHLEESRQIPTPARWKMSQNKSYLKSLDWRLPSLGETKEKLAKKLLALTNEPEPAGGYGTVESSYYREAGKIVGKKDYWTQPTELFARAFESYVQDALGRKSQYLVHSTGPESRHPTGNPYPEGLERVEIHAAFAALFEEFVRIPADLTLTIGEEGTAPIAVEGILLRAPQENYDTTERRAHNILGRLQRLIGMVHTSAGILPTSEGVTGDRDGIRTLGLGINRAFMEDQAVSFRGQQIETADDLAMLAQVFRDPGVETFRIFYTKQKEVVGQEGISSRLPGSIAVFVSDTGEDISDVTFFATMQQRMDALGADGYYLLHNHPSGESSASNADIEITENFIEHVPGFIDHVIINSNEYTTISKHPTSYTTLGLLVTDTISRDFGPDQLLTPSVAHTLLARTLGNVDEVAQFGKELQSPMGFATIVYLDALNRVRAIQEAPVTFFEDLAKAQAYLGEHGRAFGSERIITYYHTTNIYDPALPPIYQNIKSLIREGFLADHVFDSPDLSRRFSARERDVMVNKGMVLGVQMIPSLRTVGDVFGKPATAPAKPNAYALPEMTRLDQVIRTLQDSNIDLVRLVNAMKDAGRVVPTELNPILRQDASSGRIMNLTDTFVNEELKPLIALLNTHQVSLAQLDEYLIARHAEEANFHLQEINPDLEDNEALSGMTNAKARSILDRAAPAMPSLAQHADRIIQRTRALSVEYGLESQEDIDIVSRAYLFYVPLQRAGFPEESSSGRGASVRGSSLTSRVGGTQAPINVLANIAMAREAVIGRGERQRPITALAGLLSLHPDKNIATLARPVPISYTDPETGIRMKVPGDVGPYKFPTIKFVNKETGRVEFRPDPNYKGRDNVVNFRVRGIDYAIIFNEFNPRALEMAKALNGLGVTELNGVMAGIATATRYIAAINTQYDPVFGLINFVRDAQFAMVSLSSTPLKGKRGAVLSYAVEAIHSIYSDQRALRSGEAPTSLMHVWYQRFKAAGGQTGFRQRYESSTERSEAIQRLLDPDWWKRTAIGKGLTVGGLLAKPEALFVSEVARPIRDWLTDYNQAMENAIRLSVFRVAIEQGLSDIEAASLAKNITVNFNRKGQITAQMGALFAFFNAAVQGTARIHEILFDPRSPFTLSETGKKIIRGGILLGVLEAFLLAMSGFGDDEPPEWKKSRNTIIPVPFTDKGYIAIPMPLGLNIIPNLGRLAAEAFIHGRIPKRIMSFAESSFDVLSPVGSSSSVMQLLFPTLLDPVVALSENKDWTGRKIYRTDFDPSKPTPGFTRGRDNASPWAMSLAQIINYATGGTAYVPGVSSPTPEAIDYLIKQVTGGVGREFTGLTETVTALQAGDEVNIQRVPLVGRIIGTATDTAAVRNAFYEHLHAVSETKQELKGRTEHGEETASYRRDHPESQLLNSAHTADTTVKRLHKEKNRLVKLNAPHERVKLLDMQVLATMKQFNEQYSRVAP